MSGIHVKPEGFGLPYATAAVDSHGYHCICPVCGVKCYGRTPKTAARVYANHFTDAAATEGTPA